MKEDAKVTQMEAKDQDGFLSSLRSLISSITSENNPKEQNKDLSCICRMLII